MLMTVTRQEGLSGKRCFISRSLTGVGRSGSCLQSEVVMTSPTPCILSPSFVFPLQKNVYPAFGSEIQPSSSVVSLRALKRHPGLEGCARSMRRKSSLIVDSYRF